MGLSPPLGLGNKHMRFVRHCSGIMSPTLICLTMKARLAVVTSGSALSSTSVQLSVLTSLLLRSSATARAKARSEMVGRACSAIAASARHAWRTWYKRGSPAW